VLAGVDSRLIDSVWDYISPHARTALLHLCHNAATAAAAATEPAITVATFATRPARGSGSASHSHSSSSGGAAAATAVAAAWVADGGAGAPLPERSAFGSVVGSRPATAGSRVSNASASPPARRARGGRAAPLLVVPAPEELQLGSSQAVADAAFCLLAAFEIQQLGQQVTFGRPRRFRAPLSRPGSARSSGGGGGFLGLARPAGPNANPVAAAAATGTPVAEAPSLEAAAVADAAAEAIAAAAAAAAAAGAPGPAAPAATPLAVAVAAARVDWEEASGGGGDSTLSSESSFAFPTAALGGGAPSRASALPAPLDPGSLPWRPAAAAAPATGPAGVLAPAPARFLLVMGAGGGPETRLVGEEVPALGGPSFLTRQQSAPPTRSGSGAGVAAAAAAMAAALPLPGLASGGARSALDAAGPPRVARTVSDTSASDALSGGGPAPEGLARAGSLSGAAARALIRAASNAGRPAAPGDREALARAVAQLMLPHSRSGNGSSGTPGWASEDERAASPARGPQVTGSTAAAGGTPPARAEGEAGPTPHAWRPPPRLPPGGPLEQALAQPPFLSSDAMRSSRNLLPKGWVLQMAAAAAAGGRVGAGPSRAAAGPARGRGQGSFTSGSAYSTEILKSSRHLLPKGWVLQMAAGFEAAALATRAADAAAQGRAGADGDWAVESYGTGTSGGGTGGGLQRRGSDPGNASEPHDIDWGAALGRRPSLDGGAGGWHFWQRGVSCGALPHHSFLLYQWLKRCADQNPMPWVYCFPIICSSKLQGETRKEGQKPGLSVNHPHPCPCPNSRCKPQACLASPRATWC
jgi:hypothetical protein